MKKTLEYLYIFSKLSTSFILIFIILIFCYFFYLSFKNQDKSKNDQSELIYKINNNEQKLSNLSGKIELTEISLDEIKKSIQNLNNSDQSDEIVLLKEKIELLNINIKNISDNLNKIKTTSATKSNHISPNEELLPLIDKNKKEIINLIIYKFENNLNFNEELEILQNFDNRNQHIFEKINVIKFKNFRGNSFLTKIFSEELDLFLKEKLNESSNNIISKSFMNFIDLEPSNINTIKNNETFTLKEIKNLLKEKNYKISYKKIITIENYQKYFTRTLNQIKIANDFKDLINKIT